jgi:CHAD domain-containing protein
MTPLTPWLARFEAARAAALRDDAEGLHEVRALARRLRVWLQLAGLRVLEGDLRWLGRETSALRDLDVLDEVLTAAGRAQLRPPARRRAFAALRSPRVDGLVAALRALPALDEARARASLRDLEAKLGALSAETDDELHALRKRVRRVRYAREWLGKDAAGLRGLQAVLGPLADLAALRRLVTSRTRPRPPTPRTRGAPRGSSGAGRSAPS